MRAGARPAVRASTRYARRPAGYVIGCTASFHGQGWRTDELRLALRIDGRLAEVFEESIGRSNEDGTSAGAPDFIDMSSTWTVEETPGGELVLELRRRGTSQGAAVDDTARFRFDGRQFRRIETPAPAASAALAAATSAASAASAASQ